MPSSFIYGALLATAHADETALIQAQVSRPLPSHSADGSHSRTHGVESLLESAKGFLKNGATKDVTWFVGNITAEVRDVTIPAIEHASRTQQAMVYDMHDQFQVHKNTLSASYHDVNRCQTQEDDASALHKECRDIEASRCIDKRECEGTGDTNLYDLWLAWEFAEEELREVHSNLHGHFCPPDANGTLESFRVRSKPWMEDYMRKKEIVDTAERIYDDFVHNCVATHDGLNTRSSECNTLQIALEEKSCECAHTIRRVLTVFHPDYDAAISDYEAYLEVVRSEEEARHREFVTLQVVQCLLNRTLELDGVPCDTADGVTDEVGHCEERHSLNVCVENPVLCIDMPPPPPKPPNCLDRDTVRKDATLYPLDPQVDSCTWLPGGNGLDAFLASQPDFTCTPITYVGAECLPVVQPYPCTAPFVAREYSLLPPVPQAPFTHENPGCNAYPPCGQLTHCDFEEAVHPEPVFDCRLSAYWEFDSCGCGGNDQNQGWCGGIGSGDCPDTIETSICPSGTAYLAVWHPKPYDEAGHAGRGHPGHLIRDGCEYIWHAQYACQAD